MKRAMIVLTALMMILAGFATMDAPSVEAGLFHRNDCCKPQRPRRARRNQCCEPAAVCCEAAAPSCGCESAAPSCGCESAPVEMYSEPAADCGCSAAAAPACGCEVTQCSCEADCPTRREARRDARQARRDCKSSCSTCGCSTAAAPCSTCSSCSDSSVSPCGCSGEISGAVEGCSSCGEGASIEMAPEAAPQAPVSDSTT